MNILVAVLLVVLVGHRGRCDGDNGKGQQPDQSLLDIIVAESKPGSEDDKAVALDEMSQDQIDRIVGGEETTILEHPYQISFIVNNQYFCGGFIISEDYIVTAAHCAKGAEPQNIVLRAGSTNRKNGTIIPIAEVFVHPQYDQPRFDKDVGVLKTAEKINFTDTIQPIPLAEQGRPMKGGTSIIVSGWGRTRFGASTIPDTLMAVQIPVVNHLQCMLVYSSVLTDNEFCAGNFFLGGQGTCQGDSGGAAIQDGKAVGIVSYGRGCGQPLSPSVFADIASNPIREFIKEKTGI